ncbi:hypothetical protein ACFX12_034870 [Malus domestica]
MDFANIQAQLANLTSQLSQIAGRTTMQNVPTFGVSYGHGYQTHQHPQFTVNEDAWGYQGYDQPSNNMFSNAYNSAWRDHSNYMWGEPQQFQQDGYWQQDEEFYSKPMQYAQSNSGSSINYNQILNELNCLVQGSQNQAKEAQQDAYWQPYEEFYTTPIQPPQHPPQQFQSNQSTSLDNDTLNKLLTSLKQGVENQNQEMQDRVKRMDELDMQVGQIVEFMAQIRDQSDMKDEAVLEPSKYSPNMDELLLQTEEEEDDLGSLEEFLLQAPQIHMFLIPNIKESEKDIVEALPKVQSDIPILGAPKQVPDGIETFKEPCTPRKGIQENEVVEAYQEYIQEVVHETIKPKAVEFDDTGQATTIIVNLAQFKVPEMFKDVAPTLEFKPLPNHFKYHLPLKDKFHALEPSGV